MDGVSAPGAGLHPSRMLASLAVALLLAALLLATPAERRLVAPNWVALLGGFAVGYVFLHLLPLLAHLQAGLAADHPPRWLGPLAVNVLALVGFLVSWYAMGGESEATRQAVRFRVGFVAVYCLGIGTLVSRTELTELPFSALALGPHLLGSSRWTQEMPARSHRAAHLLFAAALIAGWLAGTFVRLPIEVRAAVAGLLSGGLVVNTFVVEMRELKGPHTAALAFGALAFAALAMVTERVVSH